MSVRWKPLIILSGLFMSVACCGLLAFVFASGGGDVSEFLDQARERRDSGKFDDAEIYYGQALQVAPRDADLHQEVAAFYDDWADHCPAERRSEIVGLRLRHLNDAATSDKAALAPRLALLEEAIAQDDLAGQAHWASQVAALDPTNPDALFVLAADSLEASPPKTTEAARLLDALKKVAPELGRTAFLEARLAEIAGDSAALDDLLGRRLGPNPPNVEAPIDRLALLRLFGMRGERASDSAELEAMLETMSVHAAALLEGEGVVESKLHELGRLSRLFRERVEVSGGQLDGNWNVFADLVDAGFRDALEAVDGPNLPLTLSYATQLYDRGRNDESLALIERALTPLALKAEGLQDSLMPLHELAIKILLARSDDPERFEKARSHIEGLLASQRVEYQGLGHLFNGAIALEGSGINGEGTSAEARSAASKARLTEARTSLREAVRALPQFSTAKALYGISLMLSEDPVLGRQYLLDSLKAGNVEPRYRVWAAWSLLQANYPEEAQRVLGDLLAQQDAADQGPMAGALRVVQNEIARRTRSSEDLGVVRTAYDAASHNADEADPSLALRLAELTLAVEGPEAGLARLDELKAEGLQGAETEALRCSILIELDRLDEAIAGLAEARTQAPENALLTSLHATALLMDKQAEAADAILGEQIKAHPDAVSLIQLRAKILAGTLKRPEEARTILQGAFERLGVSPPLIQLAMLDIARGKIEDAEKAVALMRSRWPEASAGDLIDAQIRLARKDLAGASTMLARAIEKDPSDKVALFWKAQLDAQLGATDAASKTFRALMNAESAKTLDTGTPINVAAASALSEILLKNRDFEAAIACLDSLLARSPSEEIARTARWKRVEARSAGGDWPKAREEIVGLLGEPASTLDERVQGAEFLRRHGEDAVALKLIDQVIAQDDDHPAAVLMKSSITAKGGDTPEAVAILGRAIEGGEQPALTYLMLAGFVGEDEEPEARTPLIREVIERGLKAHPDSVDLTRALYGLVRNTEGVDAGLDVLRKRVDADSADGRFDRLMIDLCRQEGRTEEAETRLATLLADEPQNASLAALRLEIVSASALRAAREGDRDAEQEDNDRLATLIAQDIETFPDDPRFPQAEAELAIRRGDLEKAETASLGIEEDQPESPVGPLLRAQIARISGLNERAVGAYRDALKRSPERDDIRLALGRLLLSLEKPEEAESAASAILKRTPGQQDATLLRAAALSKTPGTPAQVAGSRNQALTILKEALADDPNFIGAFVLAADIFHTTGRRSEALDAVREARKRVPEDGQLVSLLIQYLVDGGPSPDAPAPGPSDIEEADRTAVAFQGGDDTGRAAYAVALGFQRGGRPDLARPWIEQASASIEDEAVMLTAGDVNLALAEQEADEAHSREYFRSAVDFYDRALDLNADSIEAINNKAWILHRYLGDDPGALALIDRYLGRAEHRSLPAELYDTLGSIQQSLGRVTEAERSFAEGLRRQSNDPMLNYHMGRLIAMDRDRSARALPYLRKAQDVRDQLPPDALSEIESILERVAN